MFEVWEVKEGLQPLVVAGFYVLEIIIKNKKLTINVKKLLTNVLKWCIYKLTINVKTLAKNISKHTLNIKRRLEYEKRNYYKGQQNW